jgi:DNA invertase Pin-like site-specific DNA recombinase
LKTYFAYTRVSTARQGDHGVSLQEQKAEIENYSKQRSLEIVQWFEERETAAKLGRRVFAEMMKRLRKGEAAGVIIHKIDRSARNLKDWADIAQLADEGVEVHFTREAVDLQSSSGRLSADVQAVVAANYIRNLREETIKGFYGRLKQGILPMPSPLGYLDAAPGKPKIADPVRGPLIKEAFRLYATGRFSQHSLCREMMRLGLRTKRNGLVSKNTLAGILSNTFYFGLISIRKGKQSFLGAHEPLISKALFDQVQDVMAGRTPRTACTRREFLFSRLVQCKTCGRSLIAEMQKEYIYYRCHTRACPSTSFREERVDQAFRCVIAQLKLHSEELLVLDRYTAKKRNDTTTIQQGIALAIESKLSTVKERLNRLTDIYIDAQIDSETFNQRKTTLLSERLDCENQLRELRSDPASALARMEEFVELVKAAYLQYESGNSAEKRQMVESALSNRTASGKTLDFTLKSELSEVAKRRLGQSGGPSNRRCRKFWKRWIDSLCNPEVGNKTIE